MELLGLFSYSPNLNIVENIKSILSSEIYSQGFMKDLKELDSRFYDNVSRFNEAKTTNILQLYNSISCGLCFAWVKNKLLAVWYIWSMDKYAYIMVSQKKFRFLYCNVYHDSILI